MLDIEEEEEEEEEEVQCPPLADLFVDVDPLQSYQTSLPTVNHEFITPMLHDLALPELLGAHWNPLLFYSGASNRDGPLTAVDDSIFASHDLAPFENSLDQPISQFPDDGYACFADDFDTINFTYGNISPSNQQLNGTNLFTEAWLQNSAWTEWNKNAPFTRIDSVATSDVLRTAAPQRYRFDEGQITKLQNWLSENLSNPFPDANAKAHLSQVTGLSVRQIERWFARTRQRKLQRNSAATAFIALTSEDQHGEAPRPQSSGEDIASPKDSPTAVQYRHLCETFNRSRSLYPNQWSRRSRATRARSDIERKLTITRLRAQSCPPRIELSLKKPQNAAVSLTPSGCCEPPT
ncbi:hypothetical protein LTR84_006418 [Exophiala bonariae]|uniref:Homeobox domain-containing protein n=1 Tax=Exophiala bonariae TaxID=1690606 RepID=A0AAV9N190_9EURO|nr:hypothetical protein LTR84_006418 [Exophiala bonariae]